MIACISDLDDNQLESRTTLNTASKAMTIRLSSSSRSKFPHGYPSGRSGTPVICPHLCLVSLLLFFFSLVAIHRRERRCYSRGSIPHHTISISILLHALPQPPPILLTDEDVEGLFRDLEDQTTDVAQLQAALDGHIADTQESLWQAQWDLHFERQLSKCAVEELWSQAGAMITSLQEQLRHEYSERVALQCEATTSSRAVEALRLKYDSMSHDSSRRIDDLKKDFDRANKRQAKLESEV